MSTRYLFAWIEEEKIFSQLWSRLKQMGIAAKQARSELLRIVILDSAATNILCHELTTLRTADNLYNVIKINTSLNPEEVEYLHRSEAFQMPLDDYGAASFQLENMVRIIDAKTGGHMSKNDIDRVWVIFKNYASDNGYLRQLFLSNRFCRKTAMNLSPKDYQNIISQYILSDGEVASITKYAKQYNVSEDLLRRLVVEVDEKTGGHMSDQDIEALAKQSQSDKFAGKNVGTSDKLGAASLELIREFSAPPTPPPTGGISKEEQVAIDSKRNLGHDLDRKSRRDRSPRNMTSMQRWKGRWWIWLWPRPEG